MISFAVDGAEADDFIIIRHGDAGEMDLFRLSLKGFQVSSEMLGYPFSMEDLFGISEIHPTYPGRNGIADFEGQAELRRLIGQLRAGTTLPIILRVMDDERSDSPTINTPTAVDLPPPPPSRSHLPPVDALGAPPIPAAVNRSANPRRRLPRPQRAGVSRDSLSDEELLSPQPIGASSALLPPPRHQAPFVSVPPSDPRGAAAAGSPGRPGFSRVGHFTTLAIRVISSSARARFPQDPIYTVAPGTFRYVGVYNDSMGKPIPVQLKSLMRACGVYVEDINRENYQGYNDCGYWSALNLMYLCRCPDVEFGSGLIRRKVQDFYGQMESVYAAHGGRRDIIPPHYTRSLPADFEWKYNSAVLRICIAYFAWYYMNFYDPRSDPFTIKQNIRLPDYVGDCDPSEFPIA